MLQAAILQLEHQFVQTGAVVKAPAPAGTDELPSGRSFFNVTRGRCQICWCFLCPDSSAGEHVAATPLTLLLAVSSQLVPTQQDWLTSATAPLHAL